MGGGGRAGAVNSNSESWKRAERLRTKQEALELARERAYGKLLYDFNSTAEYDAYGMTQTPTNNPVKVNGKTVGYLPPRRNWLFIGGAKYYSEMTYRERQVIDARLAASVAYTQGQDETWRTDNPDFDMAVWYAQKATDDTLESRQKAIARRARSNFDPNRGELMGTTFGGYAADQTLGKPFVDKVRQSQVSFISALAEPFEVDYPYDYDNKNLYMKVPKLGGNTDMYQGFSDKDLAVYRDLQERGSFIDTSDGNAGPGEYVMMWIEDPPRQSTWERFISNPVVNVAAAIIPGGAQALAVLKGLSGMTLHASDWFAVAGGYEVVGQEFGDFAAELGASAGAATGSTFIADAVTRGSLNTISAVITGQDPLEAFVTGGAQAGVSRVLGRVNELTNGSMDALLNENGALVSEDTRVFNGEGEVVSGTPAVYEGNLAYDLIAEGIASQLATGEINEFRMANIISAAAITSETVGNLVGERLPPGGVEMLTRSLQSTLTAAAMGGSGSDAFQRSMAAQLERAVRQSLQNGTFAEDVAEVWDRASGDYGTLYEQAAAADEAAENRAEAAKQVNDANQAITEGADNLAALAETANGIRDGRYIGELSEEEVDAYDAAMRAYNKAEDALTTALTDQYLPTIEAGQEAYDAATDAYNAAVETYESTRDNMSEASQEATADIAPLIGEVNQATVTNLNPDFDADFYAEQHGLAEGEDAYAHYLSEGLYNNLVADPKTYEYQQNTNMWDSVSTVLENNNISLTNLTPEQLRSLGRSFEANFDLSSAIDPELANEQVIIRLAATVLGEDATGLSLDDMATSLSERVDAQPPQEIQNPYLNGARLIPNPDTGLLEWDNVSLEATTYWDSETGQFLVRSTDEAGFEVNYDLQGNQVGNPILRVTQGNDTFEWLQEHDPELFLDTLARMDQETADATPVQDWWVDQARQAFASRDEDGGEGMTFLSNLWVGTASVLQDIQSVVAAMGIDPTSTPFYQGLDAVINVAEAALPEETRVNTEAMYRLMADAEPGVSGAASAIFGAASEYPSEFLSQVIGLEGMQELVPLLATMVTTGGVGTAARFAGYADDAARLMASRAGLSAGMATDMAESFGGTFNGAYEESYALAKASGMSDVEADRWAIDAANTAAVAATTFTLISAGVGGQSLERLYVTGGANGRLAELFGEVGRRIENGATITIKEGITEGLEEGGTAAVLESLLYQLDPTRDVSGTIAMNAFLGAIIGGPIAGTTALFEGGTGNSIADFMQQYNPQVSSLLGQENISQEALREGLESAGISGAVQDDLMNFLYDEVYTSTAEATDALEQLGLPYTPEDIANTAGGTPDADLDATLAEYWALTYGTDTDTDGDSIPDVQDPEPDSPSTVGIEVDPDTGDTTYIDDEGYVTVVDTNGEVTQYNPDGTAVVDTDVVDEVVDEDVVDEVVDEDVVDEVVDEDVVDEVIDEDVVDEVIDEDVVDEVVDEDVVDEVVDEDVVDEVIDEDVVDEVIDEDVVDEVVDEDVVDEDIAEDVVDEVIDEDVVDEVVDEDVVDEVVDEDVVDEDIAEDVVDEVVDEDVVDEDIAEDVTDLGTELNARIDELEASGITRDEATNQAIAELADQLGTTEQSILDQLGTTEEALAGDIEAVAEDVSQLETALENRIDELEASGITRDEATNQAIAELSGQLGTTAETLQGAIAGVSEDVTSLSESVLQQIESLGLDIQTVADFVGRPASEVDQTHVDFVADVIAQQEVLEDPTSFVPTDQQLQYDVNNDGVIDINDQTMLEQAFGGQDVTLGGQFASTGLYAYNDQIAADQALQAQEQFEQEQQLEQERNMELQTQITQQQQERDFEERAQELATLQAAQQRTATTKQMGVAEIDYMYDLFGDSIFATPKQESLFTSPYAKGGAVKDRTDRLLKIIGED
jgi:hypothetical protein